jgi:cytochrome c peroxidase
MIRMRFPAIFFLIAVSAEISWSGRLYSRELTSRSDNALVPLPRTVPSPPDNPTTSAKAALGKQLFFDPRLSGDNTMSCASCHLPEKAFADGHRRGRGRDGKTLMRNTPSLLNVGFKSELLWDGRVRTLEQQALIPLADPNEMNQDLTELEKELRAIPGYAEQFQKVFGQEVRMEGIAKALAAFERTLVTKPSPFDRYLQGNSDALSAEAKRGLELFAGEANCVACHRGPLLSDGEYYRVVVSAEDEGRGAVTGEADRGRFRTPPLRNVANTAPYMHDGSQQSLHQVVEFYLRGVPAHASTEPALDVAPLLGVSYSEIGSLVSFLRSLTGELPDIEPPQLP